MMRMFKRSSVVHSFYLALIFAALLGLRWAWSEHFHTAESPRPIDEGVLDMRGIDLSRAPAFFLNGTWQLYPNRLVTGQELQAGDPPVRAVQVPGDWSAGLDDGTGAADHAYGYGTYRLRIRIDPLQKPVAFWFQSIQAASEIEINGELMHGNGRLAADAGAYKPKNSAFPVYYGVKGTTEIDLLVRVANYDEPFYGGLDRSVRFGSQNVVDHLRDYSVGFQLITFTILLLHGLYACILYAFNPHERALFYTGMGSLAVATAVLSGHDNLLLAWLPLNYTWAIKTRLLALLWQNLFILLVFRRFAGSPPGSRGLRLYTAGLIALSAVLVVAPASWANGFVDLDLFILYYLISFVWFIYTSGTMIYRKPGDPDVGFLLLTVAGIVSNLVWSIFESTFDVTTVYYPIDIIALFVGFASYWFKKYFRKSRENAVLNEQLRRADKLKDDFLANTSHELRTPLHGIINLAQTVVASDGESLSESSAKDMRLLINVSRRMSHLLGDLLDFARLRERRIVLRPEPVSLQAFVPGLFGMLRFMTEGKPVRLQADIDEALPPVLADEQRLLQVLYNLLHNALKYTEEGAVSIAVERNGGMAVIRIADTGVGMNAATAARIFLPYEQGSYGISDGRGLGLGLSICKQLVELHGSELTVRSEEGAGSVFSFKLPIAGEAAAAAPVPLVLQPQPAGADAQGALGGAFDPDAAVREAAAARLEPQPLGGTRASILAVDDDPVNLSVLAGILSAENYRIVTAGSAREALELLDRQPWDLLIADVMMPQMSGYELTQRVRERYAVSELPILLLTARSQPADIYAGFSAGANDYVLKPVDALELRYRIRALIGLKQSVNERLRMEAAYLQAQIHPHFLFNTLNSIMTLSDIDTGKMRQLADAFASFLRISFDFLNTGERIELSRELKLVEDYLYIEQERFGDRLSVRWEVEPGIELLLPPLSVQPLVENAVKHGLLSRHQGGTIRLRASAQEGGVAIEVQDNGIGISQERIEGLLSPTLQDRSGIGLANTNRRLLQLYGRGLTIRSRPGEGTSVSFFVPRSPAAKPHP